MTATVCWSETGNGSTCGGRVEWQHTDGRWRGACSRCGASGRAAVGEALQLERALEARREASS